MYKIAVRRVKKVMCDIAVNVLEEEKDMLFELIDHLSPVLVTMSQPPVLPTEHSSHGRRIVQHYELEYIIEGAGYILVNDIPLPTSDSSLHFRTPGTIAEGIGIYKSYFIIFDMNRNVEVFEEFKTIPAYYNTINSNFLMQTFLNIYENTKNNTLEDKILFKNLIFQILYAMIQNIEKSNYVNVHQEIRNEIKNTIHYINNNYQKQIKVSELSELSGYSIYHYERLFKTTIGCSPIQYINQYRIMKSKALLINYQLSLEEVSWLCGFHSYSYFYRQFKKFIGITPYEYRKGI